MEPDMDDFGHIDEFEDINHCAMCGKDVGIENMVEVDPDLDPVCPECAEVLELDRAEQGEEARRDWAAEDAMDARRIGESTMFDKFMDRIMTEGNRPKVNVVSDSPQRLRAARHQERPLGKTRFGGR